ncbi:hypothetical protein CN212_03405 [Sinorhizobium meliloti]|nr:hypothetical protein CN216_20355 [Sinorhizobium meliloti]RVH53245.1 hypothetical protein CN212_03405 [Sinorhizobium meliloti]
MGRAGNGSGDITGVLIEITGTLRATAFGQQRCLSSQAPQSILLALDRLCEISVVDQVNRLARTPIIQDAWKAGADLSIHGWVYGLKDGLLSDLKCTVTGR